MKPNIGFQLSSITPYLDTEEKIKASFEKIARIGYAYLQLQGVPSAIKSSFIAGELKKNGLVCVASQEDYPFGFGENPAAAIERAVICGCKYIAFALIPREADNTDELRAFAERIAEIGEEVERAGLVFSFHPIGSDYREMDGIPVYERLLALLPQLHLTFCVQAALGNNSDNKYTESQIESIFRRYGGKTELVHFKDNITLPDGTCQLMPLGEGSHDWRPYYRMCTEYKTEYIFAEQERWTRDAFDCARASYDYLTALSKSDNSDNR
ncbi:MAG: TIM barrel protein [Eubacteriales bacterium]|nr:TIM barrel protein [Eubacteriales bacterium]